jgi:hypothetical protein
MTKVPQALKMWFIIHFAVDYFFGIPLLIAPFWTLDLLGYTIVEPLLARLVGAALLGIGGISLLAKDYSKETYRALLSLKIIWSLAAIVGITLSIFQGSPPFTFVILILFASFSGLWMWWRSKLQEQTNEQF